MLHVLVLPHQHHSPHQPALSAAARLIHNGELQEVSEAIGDLKVQKREKTKVDHSADIIEEGNTPFRFSATKAFVAWLLILQHLLSPIDGKQIEWLFADEEEEDDA